MGTKIGFFATILMVLCLSIGQPTLSVALCMSIGQPTLSVAQQNDMKGLQVGFYSKTCPKAEQIIAEVVKEEVTKNPGLAAGLIRLFFHDCFVNGCDASILLDATPTAEQIEKESPGNLGTRGFEIIDKAKARLEQECPQTVSCADIMSFAARDAVVFSGLESYQVPAGRRDGLTSISNNVFANLPNPDSDVDQMEAIFTRKGLNKEDLVVLLGTHSVGVVHCFILEKNFYNFNNTKKPNPYLDPKYVEKFKAACPPPNSPQNNKDNVMQLNLEDPNKMGTIYYSDIINGKASIPSDQNLLKDPITKDLVNKFASNPAEWTKLFSKAMVKMGTVDVLTGQKGEIRKSCRTVNTK